MYSAEAWQEYEEEEEIVPLWDGIDRPGDVRPEDPIGPVGPPVDFGGGEVTLSAGGVYMTYYRASSQMTKIEAPAGTQVEIYDGDPDGTSVAYIRGLGLIASRDDSAVTYYHYDAHGDVVQTTTAWNAVKKDYF